MKPLKPVISEHVYYYILLMILSLPLFILEEIVNGQILPGVPLSALMVFIPSLALLILFRKNKEMLLMVVGNVVRFRTDKNIFLLLASIFIMPVVLYFSYLYAKFSGSLNGNLSINILHYSILLIVFLFSSFGEEIGWTGFMLKDLVITSRYKYYIIIPFAYITWHFIPFVQTDHTINWIIGQTLFSFFFRILIIQVYIISRKAGLLCVFVHATYNLSWQAYPVNGSMYNPWNVSLVLLIVIILTELYITGTRSTGSLTTESA